MRVWERRSLRDLMLVRCKSVWYKIADLEGGALKEEQIHSVTVKTAGNQTDEGIRTSRQNRTDQRPEPVELSVFRHAVFYGGPVLAYAALIFFLSSLSRLPEAVPAFFGFDKIAHFIEYYFFGWLIYRAFTSSGRRRDRRYALLMTLLIGAAYALSDEWHQSFVPGRDASLWDVLFDTAGVVASAATYPLILQSIVLRKAG
jgi:VanZ family protein